MFQREGLLDILQGANEREKETKTETKTKASGGFPLGGTHGGGLKPTRLQPAAGTSARLESEGTTAERAECSEKRKTGLSSGSLAAQS